MKPRACADKLNLNQRMPRDHQGIRTSTETQHRRFLNTYAAKCSSLGTKNEQPRPDAVVWLTSARSLLLGAPLLPSLQCETISNRRFFISKVDV